MSKNIALFIDGTWNDTNKKGETNVHKLYKAALSCSNQYLGDNGLPCANDEDSQVSHYIKGVGTGGVLDKILGGAAGFGTENKIKEAYDFLASNYKDKDNIYLFGFSRGAFAARSLAAFVGVVGPTFAGVSKEKIAEAYALYVKATGLESYKGALRDEWGNGEVPAEMYPIPIHFIGVWDTVRMLGLQLGSIHPWTQHHDHPRLPSHIIHARHALALHELRPEFEPTLWEDWGKGQSLKQIWFPGAHSDVGGGYTNTELSDITLHWMAYESTKYELKLNSNMVPAISPTRRRRIHYQSKMLGMHRPRKIFFSDWKSKSDEKIMESFFIHEAACGRLLHSLNSSQREYWQEWDAKPQRQAILVSHRISGKYGELLTEVDERTLSFCHALCFRKQGGVPQGLENGSLNDVASCIAKVKGFFENEKIEEADVGPLAKALPLFILVAGDCCSYAQFIETVTKRVCEEANRTDGEPWLEMQRSWLGRVKAWLRKLESIQHCLCNVPGGEVMRQSVENGIQKCTQKKGKLEININQASLRQRSNKNLRL